MGSVEQNDEGLRGFDSYEVSLGDHLRGERATAGKSLLDVQRELRIRASYIAAIENSDLAVFPNQGFVAGYVKSYARYLRLDPEQVYQRFCEESGFGGVNAGLQTKRATPETGARIVASGPIRVAKDDPLLHSLRMTGADLQPGLLERLSVSAIGSLAVLALLVGAVGYGGFRVLNNIQRVEIVPVEERPETLSDVSGLTGFGLTIEEAALTDAPGRSDTDLSRLYQPRELEIPVVEQRDGPIVDIDPDRSGLIGPPQPTATAEAQLGVAPAQNAELAASEEIEPLVREAVLVPTVHVVARQPAWVRVYERDGSILFEQILDTGETYTLPKDVQAPLIRAGNAGAVFLVLNDRPFGPLGQGATVVKDISLIPDDIREIWPEVTEPPEVVQETVSALNLPSESSEQ